ncbi:MAG: von Willebrand factor type A domain-containing protein [Chitinophagaceae bacterium]
MKRILFMLVPVLLILIAFRPDTPIEVTGTVRDETGAVIAGVIITVKGTSTTVGSGADGKYTIKAPANNSILVFSMIGFSGLEEKINGRSVIDVVLISAGKSLEEVVVTGYGIQRKTSITGSVSRAEKSRQYAPMASAPDMDPAMHNYKIDKDQIAGTDDEFNTEDYDHIVENRFVPTTGYPLSTFSIDVDAASYSNVRRMLNDGELPPAGAVRIEEMINYFKYDYAQPTGDAPFAIHTEMAVAPWNNKHQLVLIGLQGKKIPMENLPASNLVFLIDVSGSMDDPDKLGLVKSSLKMLTDQLRPQDRVSIVVYAGAAGLVLQPTSGSQKNKIKEALEKLDAGGSTAGGEGLRLAYKTAREQFKTGGNNRVILCTDGDFNVGESSDDAMERLIEKERKSGVFLTVLGYGMGNYKDNKMQKLADKGNGNHAYIDGISEARKVLVSEFGGTLFTIAKDVKLQIEFNPAKVQGYRLIGYENRMLAKEDFNDDLKDAGELGSGHTVTALYEIIPVGVKSEFLDKVSVDPLKYSDNKPALVSVGDEVMTIKFRYKEPAGDVSKLITHPVSDKKNPAGTTSANFRFAASVAEFGMLLRNSEFKSDASFSNVLKNARAARGTDPEGYRSEFIRLVQDAESLTASVPARTDAPLSVR